MGEEVEVEGEERRFGLMEGCVLRDYVLTGIDRQPQG